MEARYHARRYTALRQHYPQGGGSSKIKIPIPPNVNTFITHVTTIANRVKRFLSCADNR